MAVNHGYVVRKNHEAPDQSRSLPITVESFFRSVQINLQQRKVRTREGKSWPGQKTRSISSKSYGGRPTTSEIDARRYQNAVVGKAHRLACCHGPARSSALRRQAAGAVQGHGCKISLARADVHVAHRPSERTGLPLLWQVGAHRQAILPGALRYRLHSGWSSRP